MVDDTIKTYPVGLHNELIEYYNRNAFAIHETHFHKNKYIMSTEIVTEELLDILTHYVPDSNSNVTVLADTLESIPPIVTILGDKISYHQNKIDESNRTLERYFKVNDISIL